MSKVESRRGRHKFNVYAFLLLRLLLIDLVVVVVCGHLNGTWASSKLHSV